MEITARSWFAVAVAAATACGSRQEQASLGDLPLENGQVLRDCRIGYRTFGRLNAARSNAVLLLPWSMGKSADLAGHVGRGRLVDDRELFVIAVDALGNGVSSSPSNSRLQHGAAFPAFSMSDVVESQYRLVTGTLGLAHLKAIVGISMGGMQAFQWMVARPGFADKVVAVVGSPRTTPAERLRWQRWSEEARTESGWRGAIRALGHAEPRTALLRLGADAEDYARQAQAIMGLDVTAGFGGSLERAALSIRTRPLIVVSPSDEVVDPAAALELARIAQAEVLLLDGRCGHRAPSCEKDALAAAVGRFLR